MWKTSGEEEEEGEGPREAAEGGKREGKRVKEVSKQAASGRRASRRLLWPEEKGQGQGKGEGERKLASQPRLGRAGRASDDGRGGGWTGPVLFRRATRGCGVGEPAYNISIRLDGS